MTRVSLVVNDVADGVKLSFWCDEVALTTSNPRDKMGITRPAECDLPFFKDTPTCGKF